MDTGNKFELVTELKPCGDQPRAIAELVEGLNQNLQHQVLLGVTGSGKTFTMAQVIAQVQRPTLIIAPNKTLAGQLYGELKNFFPNNAVEYFVSYYDYYQPEAYIPQSDTYIQKDSHINEYIDKMRHSATRSLLDRNDVVIVASVSCIYGLGSPETYHEMVLDLEKDREVGRENALKKLVEIRYERGDYDFSRGRFRVRGDVLDIYPAYEEDRAIRVHFFGDSVEAIQEIDPLTGKAVRDLNRITIYPATHYVTTTVIREKAISAVKAELIDRIEFFRKNNKLIEAQRIDERTLFDLEMMIEMGYCHGIENYSRHLTGRAQGEPPPTLLDYFPKGYLVMLDESHITVPQLNGMYNGDFSRKRTLVEYGFRLPSALDNRPLRFQEFSAKVGQILYVSATPGPYELERAERIAEQIIRPTGLLDPEIIVVPAGNQVDDLLDRIRERTARGERVLVTTLTKRLAESLTDYYSELGLKVRYLHSDIKTVERMEIIRDLRLGIFDVLVGINLLREGLDIPEVSLVAILDADKEGFLRSERSLIQTCGRAARHIGGTVIFYADQITQSMRRAMAECDRRRLLQAQYNRLNQITPESIRKKIDDILSSAYEADYVTVPKVAEELPAYMEPKVWAAMLKELEKKMLAAAKKLDFEEAARLRDKIKALKKSELDLLEVVE